MCLFPDDVNYKAPAPEINPSPILTRGPKAQVTLLQKQGLITQGEANALYNMSLTQLEEDILTRVANFNGNDSESIFHRIQVWGGRTGRYIYCRDSFNWSQIENHYLNLITACFETHNIDNVSLNTIRDAISVFNANVKNIGLSFITKHTRFWLHHTLGNNALPIYDSRMASHVMGKTGLYLNDLVNYWEGMYQKALKENITIDQLERHLFVYWG